MKKDFCSNCKNCVNVLEGFGQCIKHNYKVYVGTTKCWEYESKPIYKTKK